MTEARVYSLLGDSNVRRHYGRTSKSSRPLLKSSQFIACCSFSVFEASIESVRAESSAVILSCMTNFFTECTGSSTLSKRVEPRLLEILDILLAACSSHPGRQFVVSPPMYRTSPLWYREGLPEILSMFSQALSEDRPKNLHLLPSFPTPDFESDGVHLSALSGLEHLFHLIDRSEDVLDSLKLNSESRSVKDRESTRVLEDRVTVLEQDHRRLNRVVDSKIAEDSEEADFLANERLEDYVVISGMPSIPPDLSGKEWQNRAIQDVRQVLSVFTDANPEIVVVQNATPRSKDAIVTYNVKMASAAEARSIRRKFGSYFRGGQDGRPEALKDISVANRVTPETKIRISIMKLLARKYKDSNPGSRTQVCPH